MIDHIFPHAAARSVAQTIAVLAATEEIRTRLTGFLQSAGFTVRPVTNIEELSVCTAQPGCGLVCFEMTPDSRCDLTQLKLAGRGAQLLLIGHDTNSGNMTGADLREAFAILTWPVNDTVLLMTVQRALEQNKLRQETLALRQQIAMHFGFDNIIGNSDLIQSLKASAQRVAGTDIPVLLTGPSGTGKNLLAKTIHYHSPRRYQAFHIFDCSVIPSDIQEVELFGEETDDGVRAGLLEKSDGGTLLLDNLDRLDESAQAALQQFIQNPKLTRTSSGRTIRIDVRFLSATTVDPAEIVSRRLLREELLYRLNVVTLSVASLSARRGDIPLLADYFLRREVEPASGDRSFSEEALALLDRHPWPGNVRELQSTVKRAAALCRGTIISERDISFLRNSDAREAISSGPVRSTLTIKGGLLDTGQRSLIVKALNDNDWNYTRTAAELGIGRTTLWRKIKKYKLAPEVVAD